MRIRSIKPEFWRDPDTTGRWPGDLKLFYVGLWCVADDQGRFAWDADLIAADLFPFDRTADVAGLLERLRATGRVMRYEAAGRAFGFLPKFAKHQKINRPTASRLPPPPEGLTDDSVRAHGGLTPGAWIRDQGSGSLEEAPRGEPTAPPAAPAPPSAPPPAKAAKASPPKPADPRHKPLTDGLVVDYAAARGAAYGHAGPKDAKAVTALLALGTQAAGHDGAVDEVRRRWRRALDLAPKWPGCASIASLPRAWNDIGPSPALAPAAPRVGDLGAVHDDWWRRLAPADLDAFLAERVRLDPNLDSDAPYTATGIADVDGVTTLIGRYRTRARVARGEARP